MNGQMKQMEHYILAFAKSIGGMSKSTIPKTTFKQILKGKNEDGEPRLDAHCWCEDDLGNVVYDPYYEEELSKEMFNLTDEKCYNKFEPLLQKICLKSVSNHINMIFENCRKDKQTDIEVSKDILKYIEEGGQDFYGNCFFVAKAYKMCNPSVNIVCGSAGRIGKDGQPHWEYG